ncbi:MAG: hypothetical protein IK128_01675 [Clostridiales bacterium]|nr:hypothetical protein [Clostridiales bacterium]
MCEDKKNNEFADEILLSAEDIEYSRLKTEGFDIFAFFAEGLSNVDLDAIENPKPQGSDEGNKE